MAEHTLPQSHKALLQRILICLILKADPDATFVEENDSPDPVVEKDGFGRPL